VADESGPLGPGVAVTQILVVTDPAVSRDFWVGVLGAELYREYGGTSVRAPYRHRDRGVS